MTSKQKALHLQKLTAMITAAGFKPDSYGNYKITCNHAVYRIKLKKINIRVERKYGTAWHKCFSMPIVNLSIESFSEWLATRVLNNTSTKINNTPSL